MIKHMLALAATAALAAATPAAATGNAATLSVAQAQAQAQDDNSDEGFFATNEARIGAGIFGVIFIFGVLVAAGVFDDEDDQPASA